MIAEDDTILESGVRTFLLGNSDVMAISRKVYGLTRPQNADTLPDVLIQRTQTAFQEKLCGRDPLASASMQIESYAMNLIVALQLAKAVKASFDGFSGLMGECFVDKVLFENQLVGNDPDPGIARVIQIYTFWYEED